MLKEKIAKDERVHWENWQKRRHPEAGDFLAERYLPLVDYVVQRFMVSLPKTVDKDDVRSFAFEGLLDAFDKFDITRDLKFETYASWRIKGAIMDGLRKSDWLPRSVRDKVKKIENAYAVLEQENNHSVTDAEVSSYLGITKAELNKTVAEAALSTILSMDENPSEGADRVGKYKITADTSAAGSPERQLYERTIKEALADAIGRLPEREKLVISLCYFEDLKLTEIAEVMSVSVSRISQLHSKAIMRLHAATLSVHEHY